MKRTAATKWLAAGLAAVAVSMIAAAFAGPAIAQTTAAAMAPKAGIQGVAGGAALGSAVQVTVTVVPSRLIVIDKDENIVEIYSNTRIAAEGSYALHVREGDEYEPEVPLTAKVQAQYVELLSKVDWARTGQVYGQ